MKRASRFAAFAITGCFWVSPGISQTLTLVQSEGDFLAKAPIVSTENFDSFETPTFLFETSVLIDEVVYAVPPDAECIFFEEQCWIISGNISDGPDPVTPPNMLISNSLGPIGEGEYDTISFGDNQSVMAFGFYFLSVVSFDFIDCCVTNFFGWEIVVHENDGTATTFDLPPITAGAPAYFGFISEIGITSIEVGSKAAPGNTGQAFINWGYDAVSRAVIESTAQEISIDVKPGHRRNVINPRSRGRFWLAILSDGGFDALQVDPESVTLGPGQAPADRNRVKDIDRDGLPDLMLRFRTPEVGLQCGDTEVELSGATYAGDSIIGTDAVNTVGCKKSKNGKKK